MQLNKKNKGSVPKKLIRNGKILEKNMCGVTGRRNACAAARGDIEQGGGKALRQNSDKPKSLIRKTGARDTRST